MNRIKHFMILALALTLSLGAWAQGQLLTTINASSGFTNGTQTFDNIVTVTLDDASYDANDGWYASGSPRPVEVAPVNGVTVTSYMLYFSATDPMEFEGSSFTVALEGYRVLTDDISTELGTVGITKIEVYGYAATPDPYVPALDETTGHWNFLMPGSNKVVKAVLYDSIVLGPHVELYDADPAFAAGDIYTRGDSTIYYYDTNNHHSFYLRADEQADGKYFGYWSDLDPTDYYYTDRTYRRVSTGSFTCGQRFTAAYLENYTLTLVTPQGGGTLSLDGEIPGETTYNISIDGNTYTNVSFPFQTTVFLHDGLEDVFDEGLYPLSAVKDGDNAVIYISEPYDGGRTITYQYFYDDEPWGGNKTIFCTAVQGAPIMPNGITKTDDNTYSVMEGLTVNVTATPDAAHYLSAIDGHDTVGNYATGYSFVMPSGDKDLLAVFNDKPTLTLAQTDGGTLAAIVPEGEPVLLTTVIPTATDIIPGPWTNDTVTVTLEGDLKWGEGGWIVDYGNGNQGYVSVTAAAGFDIAYYKFYFSNGDPYIVSEETAAVYPYCKGSLQRVYTQPNGQGQQIGSGAVTRIEVYTPGTANVTRIGTTNQYYIDYGTPVTVVATPDAQHYLVSFSDDDPATERNSNIAVEKTYDSVIAPFTSTANFQAKPTLTLTANAGGTLEAFDAANVTRIGTTNQYYIDYNTSVTVKATPDATHYLATLGEELVNSNDSIHRTFTMTAPVNLPADFRAKPVLTLAQNESWGSVTLAGMNDAPATPSENPVETTVNFTPSEFADVTSAAYQLTKGDITVSVSNGTCSTAYNHIRVFKNAIFTVSSASGNIKSVAITCTAMNDFQYGPGCFSGTGYGYDHYNGSWTGNAESMTLTASENQVRITGITVIYDSLPKAASTLPAGVAQLTDTTYRVDYGTTLTVKADATELHHVANWVDADSADYPADSITYSDYFITTPEPLFPAHSTLRLTVTADATAKALFGINSYDVTASVAPTTDERGTVRIASTDVQGAAQVSDSLATVTATAQGGSTSTLTAYPAWGYHFVEWQNQNGTQVSTDNPLAVTSAVDTALVAVFDTTKAELAWSDESFTGYTWIDFNNWAPTLTNSHNVEVRYGCVEGTLNVDAQSGIVGIGLAYGHIANTPNTFHIYAVHDLSQEYFYDSVVYTLTVERGTIVSLSQNIETGGTAVFADQNSQPTLTHYYASGLMAFVAHGHTVDLVAEPAEGYHFTAWQEGDLPSGYTDIATSLEYTYTVPDATTIGLKAVFDTNVYNVTIVNDHDTLTDLAMGVDTVYRMKHFLDQPLTAEAKFGYYFVQWADSVTDNPRMVNVTGDTAFRAQYDRRTFYVTVVVDTARAHGSGTRICRYLDYFPITITPKHGYHFVQWSDGNTQNPRYVTCTGNATYSAQMAPDQFTVSGSANQNLGTISGLGNHDYMSTATLTATPNHGYRFDHWNDGVTANPRSVVVTKDTAFEAFFVIGQYTVTAASANATMGSAAGTATVNYLDTVQISATANAHYHFVKWNDNNTQNPRKVVATNNVTYTAQFAADNYTVTGLADQGMGSVTGSGSYAYLSNATLTAVPACGYLFDHWSNDSTATTITVKVTGPTTLTAYFRPAVVDTVTVTVHDTTVVTNTVIVHDTTYVDIHDSVDVTVYVHDTTTVEVPVYVHDTTMVEVLVHDTTTVEVPVYVHDTTMVEVPVYVHDTTYIDIHDSVDVTVYVYVHDTTTVEVPVYMHDTTTVEVPVYVHDTTTVTVEVPVYVHDTTTVEVPVYVHDTTTVEVPVYVYDTTTIEVPVHDTTTVTEYIVDTLWLTEYIHDTVWQIKYIYDTIYIHDTIFVGIDDVDALDAKIYAMGGQIVVEGADGNKVVLYDVTGRILATKVDEYAPLRFDIPVSGTYLVKIGNHAARRIVMIR